MMAAGNVTHIAPAAQGAGRQTRRYGAQEARAVLASIEEAEAICKVLALATAAVMDSAIQFDDSSASRWEPSVSQATALLKGVSQTMSETLGAPVCDWFTPLNLLEALGAGLWHCQTSDDHLDDYDTAAYLRVVLGSLQRLAERCRAELPA